VSAFSWSVIGCQIVCFTLTVWSVALSPEVA
jgi:hypothetical protein